MEKMAYRDKILKYLADGKPKAMHKLSSYMGCHPYTFGLVFTPSHKNMGYNKNTPGSALYKLEREGRINVFKYGKLRMVQLATGDEVTRMEVATDNPTPHGFISVEKALDVFLKAVAVEMEKGMADKMEEKNNRIAELEKQLKNLEITKEQGNLKKYFPWAKLNG